MNLYTAGRKRIPQDENDKEKEKHSKIPKSLYVMIVPKPCSQPGSDPI